MNVKTSIRIYNVQGGMWLFDILILLKEHHIQNIQNRCGIFQDSNIKFLIGIEPLTLKSSDA